jgi:hypothetical protein
VLRWYRARNDGTTRVHLVIIAWLFVIFTMALTMRSVLAGIAMFVALGIAPVALYMAIAIRRARRRREQQGSAGS